MEKDFYNEICKLKRLERSGWKMHNIGGRIESDAEHTFSLTLLALELMQKHNLGLDELKVLKMISYHELGEIDAGDIVTCVGGGVLEDKYDREYTCIKRLSETYGMPEIEDIWLEFEKGESKEAKFVRSLDKYETIKQAEIYAEQEQNPEIYREFKDTSKRQFDYISDLIK